MQRKHAVRSECSAGISVVLVMACNWKKPTGSIVIPQPVTYATCVQCAVHVVHC